MYNLYNKVCKKIDSIIYTCVHVKKSPIKKNKNRQMHFKHQNFWMCSISKSNRKDRRKKYFCNIAEVIIYKLSS